MQKNHPLLIKARRQFRVACIPMVVAIVVSVVLARSNALLGIGVGIAAGIWAYANGYRLRIVKPRDIQNRPSGREG